mmetsp:Transcript_7204/g.13076  ORF Transcript_7204/g.13076 Transcript_7204/m.13076 type:complete len:112 (-) Transcript_7204:457-792(-)
MSLVSRGNGILQGLRASYCSWFVLWYHQAHRLVLSCDFAYHINGLIRQFFFIEHSLMSLYIPTSTGNYIGACKNGRGGHGICDDLIIFLESYPHLGLRLKETASTLLKISS